MLKSSVSKWIFAGICAVCAVALVCGGMLIAKNFDATPPVDKASAATVYTRGIPISNQQYWYMGSSTQALTVSGTAVIYVYYDNTYIDSVKAVAPDLTWYPRDGVIGQILAFQTTHGLEICKCNSKMDTTISRVLQADFRGVLVPTAVRTLHLLVRNITHILITMKQGR